MATLFTNVDNSTINNAANGALQVKPAGVTTAQIASATIKQSNMAILNPGAVATSTGTTTTGTVAIAGWSKSVTTTGGCVEGKFTNGFLAIQCLSPFTVNGSATFVILRGGVTISTYTWTPGLSTDTFRIPASVLNFIDNPAAGTYAYTVQITAGGQTQVIIPSGAFMWVWEI